MKETQLELLTKIKPVSPPPYLKTRIEGALEEVKLLIPNRLLYLYAAVVILFLTLQISFSSPVSNQSNIDSFAGSMGINTTYSFYDE